jgi:hypothetical protein
MPGRTLVVSLALLVLTACRRDPLPMFPRVMLWAWESRQDLSFLDPRDAGVAFLARTVLLKDGQAQIRPRFQPLHVPPGTVLMAVVRIESQGPALPPVQTVCSVVSEPAALAGVRALQIDFDAKSSERSFYRVLLQCVRSRVALPVVITALAGWCQYDDWIRDLPVNDAVPMLFRMGPERYRSGSEFRLGLCQSSFGISIDEPIARLPRGKRIYIFHPGPWTQIDYRNALEGVRNWL